MMSKCLYCHKDISNPKAKFCGQSHKMAFRRGQAFEDKDVTIIEKTVTKNRNNAENRNITVTVIKGEELLFTNETIEERIKIYKKNYKDSTFVPNWVAHGFNSKLEALKAAVEAVEESKAVKNLGL